MLTVSSLHWILLFNTYTTYNLNVQYPCLFSNWAHFDQLLTIPCSLFQKMVQRNNIRVGCRVSGKIRALVDNPNQAPLPNGRPQRRVRAQVTGTVLRSLDHRKWEVCLDCNNEIVAVAATNVKVIGHEEGLPLVSFSVLILFI